MIGADGKEQLDTVEGQIEAVARNIPGIESDIIDGQERAGFQAMMLAEDNISNGLVNLQEKSNGK